MRIVGVELLDGSEHELFRRLSLSLSLVEKEQAKKNKGKKKKSKGKLASKTIEMPDHLNGEDRAEYMGLEAEQFMCRGFFTVRSNP